jgi:type IV pilus assembly protein PilW
MSIPAFNNRSRALGFSLVEIMVAALIGLIGSIVIFQVFAVSENQKRTTTGGADAAQSGLLALYSIEREARMAGFGINYLQLLGCNVLAYDAGPPVRDPIPAFTLVAAEITDGAAGAPDTIKFVYGDSNLMVAPVRLNTASNAGSTVHRVNLPFGFSQNDLILVGRSGSPATSCTLQQVSNDPPSEVVKEEIKHEEGVRYNKDTIAGQPNYPAWSNTSQDGGVLYNLGPTPSVSIYSVPNDQATYFGRQLTHQNLLASADRTVVMDGIVQMQAQYGKDDAPALPASGDGIVDAFDNVTPATPDGWSRVLAIRVAILARSSEFDKSYCAANPSWTGGNFVMRNADGTADNGAACVPGAVPASAQPNNWRHYRYRVFETVVPLRNHIWFPLS